MKMYLLVSEAQQQSGSASDTSFSEMGMERIERCSKHDISEEKSAQNFQTSTSPNPVLPIEGPWYLKNFGMAVEETGSTKSSENKTAQDRSGHTQIIYRKKSLVETESGFAVVWYLLLLKLDLKKRRLVLTIICSEKKVDC